MSDPTTVPMFSPDGTLGDIPYDQMHAAVQAGGKIGVNFKAPDGTVGVIPADQTGAAAKAGGQIIPYGESAAPKKGAWQAFKEDIQGLIPKAQNPYPGMDTIYKDDSGAKQGLKQDAAVQQAKDVKSRYDAGNSLPYQAVTALAPALGINAAGMEQSANEGDPGGVLGHAAAPVAALIAGTAAAHVLPKALDTVGKLTPKQIAQAVGGTSGAVAGHGTLSIPGAYYGAKGAGRLAEGILGQKANAPLLAPPPSPELITSRALANLPPTGALPAAQTGEALGSLPIQQSAAPQALADVLPLQQAAAPAADLTPQLQKSLDAETARKQALDVANELIRGSTKAQVNRATNMATMKEPYKTLGHVPMEDVNSSKFSHVGYNPTTKDLVIEYAKDGAVYHYQGVPADVAEALKSAKSKGTFFGQNIRGKYGDDGQGSALRGYNKKR